MADEALMFHIDQKETNVDVHVRFSCEEARELLDALSVLCEESEVSENLRYVRKVLKMAMETLEGDLSF